MRNTLLPCRVGRADVRITDAWICSEAEKEAGQKADDDERMNEVKRNERVKSCELVQ